MNTSENIRTNTSEEIIVLGVASTETQGGGDFGEINGDQVGAGISED